MTTTNESCIGHSDNVACDNIPPRGRTMCPDCEHQYIEAFDDGLATRRDLLIRRVHFCPSARGGWRLCDGDLESRTTTEPSAVSCLECRQGLPANRLFS